MPRIIRWLNALLISVFIMGCADKNQETSVQKLMRLYKPVPNEQCLKSWVSDYLHVPTKLPATDLTEPLDVGTLANQSLVEEATADKLACEALLSCWSDLEAVHHDHFLQRCTTDRMFSRMDEIEYVFGR